MAIETGLRIGVDATGAVAGANDAKRAIDGIAPSAKKAETSLGSLGRSMKSAFTGGGGAGAAAKEISRAFSGIGQLISGGFASGAAAIQGMNEATDKLIGSVVNLKTAILGLGLAEVINKQIETLRTTQAIETSMEAVAGEFAKGEMKWLDQLVDRLGMSYAATAEQYTQMVAGARGTALQGQPLRDFFIGISEEMTALHKPATDVAALLLQMQQMVARGKIAWVDLRLAQAYMPDMLQQLAKAMSTANKQIRPGDVFKLMEAGKAGAIELAKLGKVMSENYAPSAEKARNMTQALQNRIETAFFRMRQKINESGFQAAFDKVAAAILKFAESGGAERMAVKIGHAFSAAADVVVKAGTLIAKHGDAILGILAAIAALKFAGLATSIGQAAVAYGKFLLTPYGTAIAAVSALVALWVAYRNELITINGKTATLGDYTAAFLGSTLEALGQLWGYVKGFFSFAWDAMSRMGRGVWTLFTGVLGLVWKVFSPEPIADFGSAVSDVFRRLIQIVMGFVKAIVIGFTTLGHAAWELASDIATQVGNALLGKNTAESDIKGRLSSIIKTGWDDIKAAFSTNNDPLKEWWENTKDFWGGVGTQAAARYKKALADGMKKPEATTPGIPGFTGDLGKTEDEKATKARQNIDEYITKMRQEMIGLTEVRDALAKGGEATAEMAAQMKAAAYIAEHHEYITSKQKKSVEELALQIENLNRRNKALTAYNEQMASMDEEIRKNRELVEVTSQGEEAVKRYTAAQAIEVFIRKQGGNLLPDEIAKLREKARELGETAAALEREQTLLQKQKEIIERYDVGKTLRNDMSILNELVEKGKITWNQYQMAIREMTEEAQDKLDQLALRFGKFADGAAVAFRRYVKEVKNAAEAAYNIFNNMFRNMEDMFVEFFTTGKLEIKKFLQSIWADITRMLVRKFIMEPIISKVGQIFGIDMKGEASKTVKEMQVTAGTVNVTGVGNPFGPVTDTGIAGFKDMFTKGTSDMTSMLGNWNVGAMEMFSSISGAFSPGGGGGGGILDFIGGFAGLFASGGSIPPYQSGIVGEHSGSPEMVYAGAGGANVVPMAPSPSNINATVNVYNQSSSGPMDAKSQVSYDEVRGMVVDITLRDREENGPMTRRLRQRY